MPAWLELVQLMVQRDLRVRYRGSVLGYLWSMVNPLLSMAVLTFVFSHLVKFKIDNYPIYILVGVMCWNLFSQSLSIGTQSIAANGALLKKVRVPSFAFPAASVASCMLNFILSIVPFLIIHAVMRAPLHWTIVLAPIFLLPYLCFIYGCSLLLASLNVFYRDVGHVLEPLLALLFYATPIVYTIESLPASVSGLANLNPLVHYLGVMRSVMYQGTLPTFSSVALVCGVGVASLALGMATHNRLKPRFVYNV